MNTAKVGDKFLANNRTYTITSTRQIAAFLDRGFDGVVYTAEAKKTGRQRVDFNGLFARCPKKNIFVNLLA